MSFQAVGHWPGAGCLTSVLEGLMITVKNKHDGSQQLVHPLKMDRRKEVQGARGQGREREFGSFDGQSSFNRDARGL